MAPRAFTSSLAARIGRWPIYRDATETMWAQHRTIGPDELDKPLPVEALRQDMDALLDTIEAVHVDPYLSANREVFRSDWMRARDSLAEPLTRVAFYRLLAPLVHRLGDSHTTIWFPKELADRYIPAGRFLPLDVRIDDGRRLYATRCHATGGHEQSDLVQGAQLLAINGVPADELIRRLLQFEKGATVGPRLRRVQDRFPRLLWEVYGFEGPFEIRTVEGVTRLDGLTLAQIGARRGETIQSSTVGQPPTYRLMEDGIGLLTVPSFKLERQTFRQALQEAFGRMAHDGVRTLIIDVRDNQGGSEENGAELIAYIWDQPWRMFSQFMRKKSRQWVRYWRRGFRWWVRWAMSFRLYAQMDDELGQAWDLYDQTPRGQVCAVACPEIQLPQNPLRFAGPVYVLMNHHCYSATVGFLGAIKDHAMATLVGQESGENTNGFGEAYPFDLPNSRLFARSSTTFMLRPSGDPDISHGIIPDHTVSQETPDTGVDAILAYTLSLIREQAQSQETVCPPSERNV